MQPSNIAYCLYGETGGLSYLQIPLPHVRGLRWRGDRVLRIPSAPKTIQTIPPRLPAGAYRVIFKKKDYTSFVLLFCPSKAMSPYLKKKKKCKQYALKTNFMSDQ